MRSLIFFMGLVISLSAMSANEELKCLSHGDCQGSFSVDPDNMCFIVHTGIYNGKRACALRCYYVRSGYYCHKKKSSVVGRCRKENFPLPKFDPANPDCTSAIDPPRL